MKKYAIKPLEFIGALTEDMHCDGVYSIIRIHPTDSGWEIFENNRLKSRGHPTVESAIEAANAFHRKDVERFLTAVEEPTTEPVSEKHQNGDPYLTDAGWARWITREEAVEQCVFRDWYACDRHTLELLFNGVNLIGVTPKFVVVPTPHRGLSCHTPKVTTLTYSGDQHIYTIQEALNGSNGWEIFDNGKLVSCQPTMESAMEVVRALHPKDVEIPAVDSPTSNCATAVVIPVAESSPCVSQEHSSSVSGATHDVSPNS